MNEEIPYETIYLANTTKQVATLTDRIRAEEIIERFDSRYGIDKNTQKDVIKLAKTTA
jgi:hypothetical protein